MKINVLIILLLIFNSILIVKSLPIFSSISIGFNDQKIIDSESIGIEESRKLHNTTSNACLDQDNFNISVDRFAQLLSIHWQFDHLDSIKSNLYQDISKEFQNHIKISQNNKHSNQKSFSSSNIMDIEILKEQIFGAIQANTEGNLNIEWDKMSDKLLKPIFDNHIKTVLLNYCTIFDLKCLKENSIKISNSLDEYIQNNLLEIFNLLNNETLPKLLSTISDDLKQVLNYFNQQENLLHSDLIPWSNKDFKLNTTIDDHFMDDFYLNYACLSKF